MKITSILMGMGFMVLAGAPAGATAQDYDGLRTHTWSVYAQGGMAWAGGVAMKSVSASDGTTVSPLVGIGLNYNIRPWVRLGLNYELSKYKREQRFSDLQALTPELNNGTPAEQAGGLAYRNMWTRYHNVDFTAEFNLMELQQDRSDKRFNLYLGTGVGLTLAKGNTYAIGMGYERYVEDLDHVIYDWMRANNQHHSFQSLYVPVVLSAEYDVSPRWAVGVRGSGKYLFTGNSNAPKNLWGAGVTLRYTFGATRSGYKSNKQKIRELANSYAALQETYSRDMDNCRQETAAKEAAAAERLQQMQKQQQQLQQRNAQLERDLKQKQDELEDALTKSGFSVQFAQGSDVITSKEKRRLLSYVESAPLAGGDKFIVVGAASIEGTDEFNQELSERRLANVLDLLKENGVGTEQIKDTRAIGSSERIADPIARRVVLRVVK